MSDPNHQPQRSATRAPVDRPVRLQFDDSIDVEEGLCGNVSIGGMFATVPSARPPGTLVRFELVLSDEESVRGLGEVIWMKPAPAGGDGGMGIKFRFLEQPDRQMIFRLVSQHIKERLAGSSAPAEDPNPTDQIQLSSDGEDELPSFPPPPTLPEIDLPPAAEAPDPPAPVLSEPEPGAPEPAAPEPAAPSLPEPVLFEPELPEPEPAAPEPPEAELPEPELPEPDAPWSVIDADSGPDLALDPELHRAPDPALDSGERRAKSAGELALGAGYQPTALDDTGAAVSDPYSRSAQLRRTRPELSWPLILVALVAVAAVAATVYLFRERLFSALDPPPPAVETVAPDGTSNGAPEEAPDGSETPPDPDGSAEDADPEPARTPPVSSAAPPPATVPPPTAPPPTASTPPPASVPPPPPASTPVPAQAPAAGSFGRLVDIGWSLQQPGVRVAIATDGTIAAERFTHFRLEGGSPREVIVLRGVAEPYGRSQIPVGSDIVSGIRTGFHRKAGGNELHVVIDLADPGAKVTAIRNLGRRLEIDVGK